MQRSEAAGVAAGTYYAITRISKEEFLKSRTCAFEVRAEWPTPGGWAWGASKVDRHRRVVCPSRYRASKVVQIYPSASE